MPPPPPPPPHSPTAGPPPVGPAPLDRAGAAPRVGFAVDAGRPDRARRALADLREGLAQWRLALALARLDMRNRYRGSVLGPFWVTLSTAAMLAGLGLLYGALFRLELTSYLPHLAVSLIVWQWLASSITEGCAALTSAEGVVRQIRLPYTVHALRTAFRNAIVAAHSLPLVAAVFVVCGHAPGAAAALAPVGLALIAVNTAAAALLLGALCARFRDIPPIVANVVQLAFFLSPVLWKPELLDPVLRPWVALNPFYALLETVRGPLVGGGGAPLAWAAAAAITALHVAAAAAFFARFRSRIAFWV